MIPGETTQNGLFSPQQQFVVPLFQSAYVCVESPIESLPANRRALLQMMQTTHLSSKLG